MKEKLKKIGSAVYGIWMKFAGLVAFVNTRVLLTVVYFIVIGPLHLLMRLMGKDYLDRRHDRSPTFWKKKEPVTHSLESARRQF
ncbi:MAG TPA: SxtJ family membrane protein [Bacteroidota bacterium]|nr:SxtJ family membrane protein [Bacteroidota bacterium]